MSEIKKDALQRLDEIINPHLTALPEMDKIYIRSLSKDFVSHAYVHESNGAKYSVKHGQNGCTYFRYRAPNHDLDTAKKWLDGLMDGSGITWNYTEAFDQIWHRRVVRIGDFMMLHIHVSREFSNGILIEVMVAVGPVAITGMAAELLAAAHRIDRLLNIDKAVFTTTPYGRVNVFSNLREAGSTEKPGDGWYIIQNSEHQYTTWYVAPKAYFDEYGRIPDSKANLKLQDFDEVMDHCLQHKYIDAEHPHDHGKEKLEALGFTYLENPNWYFQRPGYLDPDDISCLADS